MASPCLLRNVLSLFTSSVQRQPQASLSHLRSAVYGIDELLVNRGSCSTAWSSSNCAAHLLASPSQQRHFSSACLPPPGNSSSITTSSTPRSLHTSSSTACRWYEEKQGSRGASAGGEREVERELPSPFGKHHTTEKAIEVRMESQVVFDACWRRFEERFPLRSVHVPREVVFLNGAPGSGKGANTVHILKTRGLDTSISLSSLLISHPEARSIIEKGEMIPDMLVGDILLESLLSNSCKSPDCGVLVDGFPRTAVQVDMLKLLYDKLSDLHTLWANTPHENQFPRPLFKVVVLYVDMETSIKRQVERAKVASLHNERVKDAGAGQLWEQRATDTSITKCKRRYEIFKLHYSATMRLKQFFPFHLIDSMGTLEETQEAISLELRYQSSLDLSQATYSALRHLPLSRDLAQHARQQLVSRLDDHCQKFPELFHQVIKVITQEIMPVLHMSGMAGRVEYMSHEPLFIEHPRATMMLIDVLTDRGFSVSHTADVSHVPQSIDLKTGEVRNQQVTKHRFHIQWDTKGVREMAKAIEIATRMAESAAKDTAQISQSFIPPGDENSKYGPNDAQVQSMAAAARPDPMASYPSIAPSRQHAKQEDSDSSSTSSNSSYSKESNSFGQDSSSRAFAISGDAVLHAQ